MSVRHHHSGNRGEPPAGDVGERGGPGRPLRGLPGSRQELGRRHQRCPPSAEQDVPSPGQGHRGTWFSPSQDIPLFPPHTLASKIIAMFLTSSNSGCGMVPGLPRPEGEPTELEEEQETWTQPRNTQENQATVQAALQDFSEGPP